MKPMFIEDDVYEFIARLVMETGQSSSEVLRKALGSGSKPTEPVALNVNRATGIAIEASTKTGHELSRLLDEPIFRTNSTAVARMLRIFQEAHDQRRREFSKVLTIQGRNRSYFAKSEEEILKSGKSTQPRQIPGTEYWVMTNSPTPQKQDMVREVLHLLGFGKAAEVAAAAAIV